PAGERESAIARPLCQAAPRVVFPCRDRTARTIHDTIDATEMVRRVKPSRPRRTHITEPIVNSKGVEEPHNVGLCTRLSLLRDVTAAVDVPRRGPPPVTLRTLRPRPSYANDASTPLLSLMFAS